MRIFWDTDVNAPGCPGVIRNKSGTRTVLVQTDYDYPGVAQTFGWNIRNVQQAACSECEHSGTDGTIDCPDCGITAGAFIESAGNWLYENDGAEADDPGYFS